jgi:hypothetical protein
MYCSLEKGNTVGKAVEIPIQMSSQQVVTIYAVYAYSY